MSKLFRKLNLKDQRDILVLNAPESFEQELAQLQMVKIYRDLDQVDTIEFLLAFVKSTDEIQWLTSSISGKAPGDPLVWWQPEHHDAGWHGDCAWRAGR